MTTYYIGIDEVGRGPLAGPVAVGLICATQKVINKYKKIKESKQLTQRKREEWSTKILENVSDNLIVDVVFIDSKRIDK
jgi:ribonuclease HII